MKIRLDDVNETVRLITSVMGMILTGFQLKNVLQAKQEESKTQTIGFVRY